MTDPIIHLDVLPPAQRTFWEREIGAVPLGWVLYGGTAIALHLGHRRSMDFDFFSSDPIDHRRFRRQWPALAHARTLQEEPDTLTVVVERDGDPLKLSFFGGIDFGRVGEPLRIARAVPIASRLDLLGTKLATITQRIEPRDYVDIDALLGSGLTINDGVAALLGLYGQQASGIQAVKTLAWFKDGGLETALPSAVRERLTRAATAYDPRTPSAAKRSLRVD